MKTLLLLFVFTITTRSVLLAQSHKDEVYSSIRAIRDMERIDLPTLFVDPEKSSAICEIQSQNSMIISVTTIDDTTGALMPAPAGSRDRRALQGKINILCPLNFKPQKLAFDYDIDGGFVRRRNVYEEKQRFSPFNVQGHYLCVARWPTTVSLTPLNQYPDIYLIASIYSDSLKGFAAKYQPGSSIDSAQSIDSALAILHEKSNVAFAINALKLALKQAPLIDQPKIQDILAYAGSDIVGATLIYQLITQKDDRAVDDAKNGIIDLLKSGKETESFRYNLALAVLAARDQPGLSDATYSILKDALMGDQSKVGTSEQLVQALKLLNAR